MAPGVFRLKTIREWLFFGTGMALAAALALSLAARRPPDAARIGRGPDAAALGRSYGPKVVVALADAWVAAAEALGRGASVAEARSTLQTTWSALRRKAFAAEVAPGLAAVLPEGTEPGDEAHRARVVAFWSEFARGLRGGR